MSIANALSVLKRIEKQVEGNKLKYKTNQLAHLELVKLETTLRSLKEYLTHLDQLKPHYDTDQIKELMKAVDLHQAILQVELEAKDYRELNRNINLLKIMLKFHPTKYSKVAFIIAWFYELLFFI